jgi:uncharacterized membrane protein SpoIIM required for sporulation
MMIFYHFISNCSISLSSHHLNLYYFLLFLLLSIIIILFHCLILNVNEDEIEHNQEQTHDYKRNKMTTQFKTFDLFIIINVIYYHYYMFIINHVII